MNKKNIFLIFLFVVFSISVFSDTGSNLIQNINYSKNILSFSARQTGMFFTLFTRDYREQLTFVNDTLEVEIPLEIEDIAGYRLRIINVDEKVNFNSFGAPGMTQGNFNNPAGIFVDYFGRIYVADKMNNRIQSFDALNNFRFEFGKFGWANSITELRAQFNKPTDVKVNRFIYISDTENHRIAKFDIDGNFLSTWGGQGKNRAEFYFPRGLAIDLSGDVYVADTENDRIQKFDGNGNFIMTFGNFGRGIKGFNKPHFIAVDLDYNMYISDTRNNRIQVYDRFTGFKKYMNFGRKFIDKPMGIHVDINLVSCVSSREKIVYVADRDEKYIKRITTPFIPEGVVIHENKIYVTSPRDNKVYYMDFERFDYVF